MGEMKGYISTLTFAGKGIFVLSGFCNKTLILFEADLTLKPTSANVFVC